MKGSAPAARMTDVTRVGTSGQLTHADLRLAFVSAFFGARRRVAVRMWQPDAILSQNARSRPRLANFRLLLKHYLRQLGELRDFEAEDDEPF
jgi:hypothetical protein